MASNFKLFLHKSNDTIHLKMFGDFDGSSAHELLNAIQINSPKSYQIFIDTGSLSHIYDFGRETFHNNFRIFHKELKNLIFIGKYKNNFYL